ncbi:unnamed protein product, partial [Aureobasidium pullulans]
MGNAVKLGDEEDPKSHLRSWWWKFKRWTSRCNIPYYHDNRDFGFSRDIAAALVFPENSTREDYCLDIRFGFAMLLLLCCLLVFLLGSHASPASNQAGGVTCVVRAASNGRDSAKVIRDAFKTCGKAKSGQRNRIVFENTTYTIASVLDTTGLKDVDIELHGTLSWNNSNLNYWLENSLPMGYQNQSTAWRLGGDGITFQGFGSGTFNGNGDAWYRFINGRSNYPRRPHQLTITGTTNSVFEGLIFLQSQMWTMTVIHSSNVLLQDIYVNNTSKTGAPTVNTDGADTIYANNITFRRWTVDNGDDAISPKANSTNILIEDSAFYRGSGIALGSIGQYDDTFETIQNVTCRNITSHRTKYGAYIKTGYPPNGGGGGYGYASNLTFEDFKLIDVQKHFQLLNARTSKEIKVHLTERTMPLRSYDEEILQTL